MGDRKPIILFLAANPGGTVHHTLDREARAIDDELARSHGQHFAFVTRWAVTPLDLLRVLRTVKPTVVHFAGEGRTTGAGQGLVLHGRDDQAKWVSSEALQQAFGVVGASVELVVLSACYSAAVAEALLAHIDHVVGMTGAISDEAARSFAVGFYGALGDGEQVEQACAQGKAAIGLEVLNGLGEAAQPQLRSRIQRTRWQMALRRAARWLGADFGLGVHLAGALGILATGAVLAAIIGAAWRAWFAFGESALGVQVQQLVVRADRSPPPVQDNGSVRAIEASAASIAHADVPPGVHRVALTGAFTSIDFGAGRGDPACRLRLEASDAGIEVERATPDGTPCSHAVIVIAGPKGLVLAIDDKPIAIAKHERLELHLQPGTQVGLRPLDRQLALFRPAHGVIWPATHIEGVSADDEAIGLPGALRRSDSFAIDGAVELRELRFAAGKLVVRGALRDWRGRIGRADDWDAAAPWPRISFAAYAAAGLVMLTLLALARVRRRWRALKELT